MALMTPLAAYMETAGLTDAALARAVGRERSTITKLRRGQANPSLDLAVKIAAFTDGAIPPTAYPTRKKAKREATA